MAINWLKNEISAMKKSRGRVSKQIMVHAIMNLIDEAFEDAL